MKPIIDHSEAELLILRDQLALRYMDIKGKKRNLNMSRGKPAPAQLDLSMELLQLPQDYRLKDGTDARNYGGLEGIPECRQLFAEVLGLKAEQILMGGNASLNLMFDTMAALHLFGTGGCRPWSYYQYEGHPVRFLCPTPGYDRHFRICEELGMEMIPIPLLADGPDMTLVKKLAAEDESVKGIWCVPLHSNPQGVCYSDRVVEELASMETAAPDFRIFWDNAYGIHHLYEAVPLKNILEECERQGHPDRAYYFFSTSKITFPGAGVSLISASPANIKELRGHMSAQTISHDKLNQLRHVQFFRTPDRVRRHMEDLAALLRPKFELVLAKLEQELGGTGLATWSHPRGGYFVSLDTLPGAAKRTVALSREAGVILTEAGATYPYGRDPRDSNLRIAPSYPSLEELEQAMDVLTLCVKLAGVESLLAPTV